MGLSSIFPQTLPMPIAGLFGAEIGQLNPEWEAKLEIADLIFGIDVMSRYEFLVFGRDMLKRIVESSGTVALKVMQFELDQESEELEQLLAVVKLVKGHHDYGDFPNLSEHAGVAAGKRWTESHYNSQITERVAEALEQDAIYCEVSAYTLPERIHAIIVGDDPDSEASAEFWQSICDDPQPVEDYVAGFAHGIVTV